MSNFGQHHIDLGRNRLLAELKTIDRRRARAQLLELLTRAEKERLAWTNRGAHRFLADRRAVVAQIALHHELQFRLHLRHAERASQHAVIASNAARLARRLHHAVFRALDRIRWTNFSAGRLIAVHANHGRSLNGMRSINIFEMNHRMPFVRVALAARLHARLAADAAIGINEKFEVLRNWHNNNFQISQHASLEVSYCSRQR